MSFKGIQQFAAVLHIMQGTRHELLGGDNQDIRLGQLLDEAKDCVKDRFAEETLIEEAPMAGGTPDLDPGNVDVTMHASMKAIDEGDTEPIQKIIDNLEEE